MADDPDSIRAAMHCAMSLFHMADWVYQSRKSGELLNFKKDSNESIPVRNEKEFCDALQTICQDFNIVRATANSLKHFVLNGRSSENRFPRRAEQTSVKALGWGEGAWGEGPWDGGPQVIVEVAEGKFRHFSAIAENVRNMWLELNRINDWW
jgi:hypothetical protein